MLGNSITEHSAFDNIICCCTDSSGLPADTHFMLCQREKKKKLELRVEILPRQSSGYALV